MELPVLALLVGGVDDSEPLMIPAPVPMSLSRANDEPGLTRMP
jgi:hypothetical protein